MKRLLSSTATWCVLAAAGAAVFAWDARYAMNPDGVAYLDMASETLHHGPLSLINGGWGPLYPALIAVLLFIFRPSPGGEYIAVHALNWFLFVVASISLGFFLKCWLGEIATENKRVLAPFGFVLFFCIMNRQIGMGTVTPDLLVAIFVFLAAGLGCRLLQSPASPGTAALLGFVLALGYFAKPSLFAVALISFALLPCLLGFQRSTWVQIGIAIVVFAAAAAPYVALLSHHAGRFSISENGTTNYLTHVSRADTMDLIRSGTLTHPVRILLEDPLTLEFASPVAGVYPLHDEFTYWLAGARIHFDLRKQIAAIAENLRVAWLLLFTLIPVCGGLFALLMLALAGRRKIQRPGRNEYWLIVWSVCTGATFGLVHLEGRYVAPFIVLLCLVAYRLAMGNVVRPADGAVLLAVSLVMLVPVARDEARSGMRIVRDAVASTKPDGLVIAEAIRSAGVARGDYVAVVGSGYWDLSYARLAGIRIIAEIPDEGAFWNLTEREKSELNRRLAEVHVKALINAHYTQQSDDSAWFEVKNLHESNFRIKPLLKTAEAAGPIPR